MKALIKFFKSLWLALLNVPEDSPEPEIRVCGPIPMSLAGPRISSFGGIGGYLRPSSMMYWEDYLWSLREYARPYATAMRNYLIKNPGFMTKREAFKFSDGTVAIFTDSFWNEFLIAVQMGTWSDRMQLIKDGVLRGSGTTTSQMLGAPKGAIYVWPVSSTINYAKGLAAFLGRLDLLIIPQVGFNDRSIRGTNSRIVVDHACRLDWDQLQLLRGISLRNGDQHV